MLDVVSQDLRTSRSMSLCGKKWKYRGEGNANLVLALSQERLIVRLRKKENGGEAQEQEHERERVMRESVFCRCVMVPLLGEEYIQPPGVASLREEEVRGLDEVLRAQRPTHRHHKGLRCSHVTVYPDYALLPLHLSLPTAAPTFCVEIKPKQGWIPAPDRRLPKCTFCLNQYLKLKHGTIQSTSQYCPLDLFSGMPTRMKNALRHLLFSPQNNLKIFQDGVLVYGDDAREGLEQVLERWMGTADLTSLVEKFCDLVYKALTCNLCADRLMGSIWDCMEVESCSQVSVYGGFERVPAALVAALEPLLAGRACDWASQPLPQDCILERILRMQRLDECGADLIYQMYRSGEYGSRAADYAYVGGLLKAKHHLSPMHRYLLATTAKDCSIMMAFQRCEAPAVYALAKQVPKKHVLRDLEAHSYVFNIGVSDLDPKPLSCIEKHRKRDSEILSACLEVFSLTKSALNAEM